MEEPALAELKQKELKWKDLQHESGKVEESLSGEL